MATTDTPPIVRHRIDISPRTIALVFGVIAAVWLLGQLTMVLSVVTVALVLVGTFDPVVSWLERKGFGRGKALMVVFFVAAVLFIGIVLIVVPPLISQVLQMIENAEPARADLIKSLEDRGWAKPLISAVRDLPIENLAGAAGKELIGYSTRLFITIGYGISTLALAIYLLSDPVSAQGMLYAVVPRHHHVKLARILVELKVIVGGYMRGQMLTSLAITIFVFVLLTILGVDNALPLALFAGITDIIPFVGGYVASTPVVVAVAPQGTVTAVVVLILMVVYQEFESRILVPRVYNRVLRLHPAVVVVALLIGGTLAGIFGALLALPIAAGVRMLIKELRVDLPGATPAPEAVRERDDQVIRVYEAMAEGATPAEAAVIAGDVASIIKEGEVAKEAVKEAETKKEAELETAPH